MRPPHRDPLVLVAVAAGAAVGTAARAGLAAAWPAHGGWPWATFLVNVTGAFLLGALLGAVTGTGARARLARMGLGTGLLGGYTTYSSFAVEAVGLGRAGAPMVGLAYVAASLLAGVAAAAAGLAVASSRSGGGR